jgi:AcrR family transcriptional regulator
LHNFVLKSIQIKMQNREETKKRIRRTKIAVDRDVLNAVNSLIEEVGFANVTLTAIAQRAKIESTVFYRRYNSLEDLFDKYTEKYDFWLSNISESIPKDLPEKEIFKNLLLNLINALYKNKGMQQLLIWELSEDNKTTRKTAKLREIINEPMIKMIENQFENTGLNINVIAALVISGIYYLILHRKRSTFCSIDFSSKTGKKELEETIKNLVDLLYGIAESQYKLVEIKQRLKVEGVSDEIIMKCIY